MLLNELNHSMVWMTESKHVLSPGCRFITDSCEHVISIPFFSAGESTASETVAVAVAVAVVVAVAVAIGNCSG